MAIEISSRMIEARNSVRALKPLSLELGLNPGDIAMSGAVSALLPAQVGDTFTAEYELLGTVELKVIA